MPTTLEAARLYVGRGLSVIPICVDGSKRPALTSWSEYMRRPPTEAELVEWFSPGKQLGVGIVCGRVSRNLEVMDFDDLLTWERFKHVATTTRPGCLEAIPTVNTPGGGRHLYFFRSIAGPNRKLARDREGKTLIEVRGEGGMVLAPGCPAACHPSGCYYRWAVPLPRA